MLLTELAASCEEYARRECDMQARGDKLNKNIELIRLILVKFVKHLSMILEGSIELAFFFFFGLLAVPTSDTEDLFVYWKSPLIYL